MTVAMRKYMDYSFPVRSTIPHTFQMVYTTTFYTHPSSYCIIDQIICTSIPPIRVQETLLAVPCINKWMKWVHLKVHQIILGLKCMCSIGLTNYKNDQWVRFLFGCYMWTNRFSYEFAFQHISNSKLCFDTI